MSASAPELQPTVPEVLQSEEPYGKAPTVPVCIDAPVRTQSLPRKAGATGTKTAGLIADNAQRQLLRADHRRASAVLISDTPFLVALSAASAEDASTMALWPADTPCTITATSDVYVAAQTGTASVSFIEELWATGQDGGE